MADENYLEMLRRLAEQKLQGNQSLASNLDPDSVVRENEQDRRPASINQLPTTGEDVKAIQDLGVLDKINMRRQGLDPWNPDDVKRYRSGQM